MKDDRSQDLVLVTGAAAAWGVVSTWAVQNVASLITGGALDVSLAEALGGLLRAAPWLLLTTAVVTLLPALLLLSPRRREDVARLRESFGGTAGGARWARPADLEPLLVDRPAQGRLVLSRCGRRLLATEARHSVIAFGPTGSFKTSGLAVPAIRDWEGPVVCASVKADLLRDTIEEREARGSVLVFDPTGATGMPSDGWSPLGQCASWPGALRMAQWLCSATHKGSGGDLDFWYRAAKKLLAPILFAAGSTGRTMGDVIRWVDLQDADEVHEILSESGCEPAIDAWAARELRDPKQQSSIYTTLETVLDAYADSRVLADSDRGRIAASSILDGGQHALYLCAPADDQDALRVVFSTLVLSITTAVYGHATATGTPLDPPLLLVLDELANVAPIPRLDVLASTGRDQGVQLLSILQDLSQLEERYGARRAKTILNNHHAKLVLSGQSDQATLDLISNLLGDEPLEQRSVSRADDRRTETTSTTFRRLAPADLVRQQRRGQGILTYGALPPARVELLPWFAR